MPSPFDRHSLGLGAAIKLIDALTVANAAAYRDAVVQTVAHRGDTPELHNYFTIVRVQSSDAPAQPRKILEYDTMVLLQATCPIADLPLIAGNTQAGLTALFGRTILFNTYTHLNRMERLSSNQSDCLVSSYIFTGAPPQYAWSGEFGAPLLNHDKEYFRDADDAVVRWSQLPGWHGNFDSRRGGLLLSLPELRAWIGNTSQSDTVMSLSIGGTARDDGLRGKGRVLSPRSTSVIDSEVVDGRLILQIPDGSHSMEVFIVSKANEILDFHMETPSFCSSPRRLLLPRRGLESADKTIEVALGGTESDTIEFKPFVKLGLSEKQNELIESVVAFANTRGGAVILGVDKNLNIEGIEQGVNRTPGDDFPAKLKGYSNALKSLLANRLNRIPFVQVRESSMAGHTLLVLDVEQGNEKPYWDSTTRKILIRKGPHNVMADPDTELPGIVSGNRARSNLPANFTLPS